MIVPRIAKKRLLSLLRQFPVIAILGPRQVGKSTLAKWALPGFQRFDLEDPRAFAKLAEDPLFFLGRSKRLMIDEVQRLPELFPVLRGFVDRYPERKLVLLGSASPSLVEAISESLGGRIGMFELGCISLFEESQEKLWIKGGFPRVHWSRPRARPLDWYAAYLRTYLEQDLPQLGFKISHRRLRGLMTMVAHSQGSVCNLSELGGSLGINYHSVSHILDIFEGTFLLRRLPPYAANVGKRLVRSPKIYLRDTGLLHFLLDIQFSRKGLLEHPKAGASFETFCLEQILLHAALADPASEGFFYRTHSGAEIDLLLKLRGRLLPIEIKMGLARPQLRGMRTAMKDLGLDRGYVVNSSENASWTSRNILACGLKHLLAHLKISPRRPSR